MKTFYVAGEVNKESVSLIQEINDYKDDLVSSSFEIDKDIKIVICSEGGYEPIGYAIYDTLMNYKKYGKVITAGYGHVCSIATLIFEAGDERLLSPNCTFMIHNGSVDISGHLSEHDISNISKHFKHENARYYELIAKRTGMSVDKIRKWCDDETYFTATEAVKLKLADKITKEL